MARDETPQRESVWLPVRTGPSRGAVEPASARGRRGLREEGGRWAGRLVCRCQSSVPGLPVSGDQAHRTCVKGDHSNQ